MSTQCLRQFYRSIWILSGAVLISGQCGSLCFGQFQQTSAVTSRASNHRATSDALRALDSTSDKELDWVKAYFEGQVKQSPTNAFSHCVLAISQFREHNFDAALLSLEQANANRPAPQVRATAGKFKLLCAINTDDREGATKLFLALVDACQRETNSAPVRKSYCEWLGEIVGTLDTVEAQSPISLEDLAAAKKSILAMPARSLSRAFEDQYELAHVRTSRIRDALLVYQEQGGDVFKQSEKVLSDKLKAMEAEHAELLKQSRDLEKENQSAIQKLRLELVSIREALAAIESEWNQVTPGLPVAFNQPIPPRLDLIYVNPYQTRWVTEYRNGRRNTYQITEPRLSWDIETERNSIYQGQMSFYNNQLALYTQYQKNLADWRRQDGERRSELMDKRKELETQSSQLRAQIDVLSNIKHDRDAVSNLKKSIADAKLELKAMGRVLQAADKGKPHLALRPTEIDIALISEEKKRLLSLLDK